MPEVQENTLEQALRLAATDPAYRPEFYRLLLESSVYIIGHSDRPGAAMRTIETGEQVSIESWAKSDGSPVIPFFSSIEKLRSAIDCEVNFMCLPARALFELVQGKSLFMDPKSRYSKEFFPNEIASLLVHGVNRVLEPHTVKAATEVLLGQPADYPDKMVEALAAFFQQRRNVTAAYLALMHSRALSEKPCLVIGIRADGDTERLIQEAGVVAGDTAPNGVAVTLYELNLAVGGVSEYFQQVKPFYRRASAIDRVRSLLGIDSTQDRVVHGPAAGR